MLCRRILCFIRINYRAGLLPETFFVLFTFKLWVVNGYFSVFFFSKFDAANMLYK